MDRKSPPPQPSWYNLPSTPTSTRRGPTHSPHTPVSSLSHLQLSNAPIKSNPFDIHDEAEDDPRKSPSVGSSRKVKSRVPQSLKQPKSVFAAAVQGITQSEPRLSTVPFPRISTTVESNANYRFPIQESSPVEDDLSRRASKSSTVDLEAFFGEKLQATPRSSKRAYIAPHRRQESQQSSRRSSYASDVSGLPEAEDDFYTSVVSPLVLNTPVQEGETVYQYSSTPRSSSNRRIAPPSLSFGYPSARPPLPPLPFSSLPRTRLEDSVRRGITPPFSPPATLIARLPYDEPLLYSHPPSIAEDAVLETRGPRSYYSSAPSLMTQELDGEDTPTVANFCSTIQQQDLPRRPAQTMFSLAESEESFATDSEEEVLNSCSSCAAPPAASFVALYPCDHLLCHRCINTLINSAAHKPPRETSCFQCGVFIKTFHTAWVGGQGTMIEALEDALDEELLYDGSRDNSMLEEFQVDTRMNSVARGGIDFKTQFNEQSGERKISEMGFGQDRPVGMDSGIDVEVGSLGRPKDPPVPFIQGPIPVPIEWPVLRLDNIPWDVTVDELEEWLPINSLAPEKNCVLAVHILCNRADGRTLNQCFVEASSMVSARKIVRHRNGKLLRERAVHITLSTQGEFMSTVFPSWRSGFNGMKINTARDNGPAPLVLLNELNGLVSLCKLESGHASKVPERGYFNIVTLLQKFPWHIPSSYNSKQIVRLYETSYAAVEILLALRAHISDWRVILTTLVDAVLHCPVFREGQKQKIVRLSGILQPDSTSIYGDINDVSINSQLGYSPPSLREKFVTVVPRDNQTSRPVPSTSLPSIDFNPYAFKEQNDATREEASNPALLALPLSPRLLSNESSNTLDLLDSSEDGTDSELESAYPPYHSTKSGVFNSSPMSTASVTFTTRRRASSVAMALGVDLETVKAIAAELGVNFAFKRSSPSTSFQ